MGKTLETMKGKTTRKEQRFIRKYLENKLDKTEAVKSAYDVSTDASARAIASQNLQKPRVIAMLEKLQNQIDYASNIKLEHLVNESSDMALDHSLPPSVRLNALELTAKLTGNFVEKRENKNFDESRKISAEDIKKMSAEDILSVFKLSSQGVKVAKEEEKVKTNEETNKDVLQSHKETHNDR